MIIPPQNPERVIEGRLAGYHYTIVARSWGRQEASKEVVVLHEAEGDQPPVELELLFLEGVALTHAAHLLVLSGRGPLDLLTGVRMVWQPPPDADGWGLLCADTPPPYDPADFRRVVFGRASIPLDPTRHLSALAAAIAFRDSIAPSPTT